MIIYQCQHEGKSIANFLPELYGIQKDWQMSSQEHHQQQQREHVIHFDSLSDDEEDHDEDHTDSVAQDPLADYLRSEEDMDLEAGSQESLVAGWMSDDDEDPMDNDGHDSMAGNDQQVIGLPTLDHHHESEHGDAHDVDIDITDVDRSMSDQRLSLNVSPLEAHPVVSLSPSSNGTVSSNDDPMDVDPLHCSDPHAVQLKVKSPREQPNIPPTHWERISRPFGM